MSSLSRVIIFNSLPSNRWPKTMSVSLGLSVRLLATLNRQLPEALLRPPSQSLLVSLSPFVYFWLEQRLHSFLTDDQSDWVHLTHTRATNTIERSTQTYAICFRQPLCVHYLTQPRTHCLRLNTPTQHPTFPLSSLHNPTAPLLRTTFSPILA